MDKYSLSAPRGLRWSHNQNKTKELWYSILHQMENQKIVFVGDSVMYQTLIGLLVYLESIGVNCTRMEPSETKYLCNKVELDRPFFIAKLDDQFLPLVLPNILSADIVIVNVGLHYGNMSCGIMSSGLCEDVRAFFHMMNQQIQNKTTHVKLAWMDAHRPHFPSADGAYLSWKDSTSGNEKKYPTCGKIMTPLTYDYVIYNPSHTVEKEFPSIPIIKTYDMTYDRYDMHLGVLTHGDPVKLDCVHLCTQICYWEAISLRIGQVINRILRKGHKT